MPCFRYFLFRSDTCTFQYEVRDVHTPMFGTEEDLWGVSEI
jgi:hypothetical protein